MIDDSYSRQKILLLPSSQIRRGLVENGCRMRNDRLAQRAKIELHVTELFRSQLKKEYLDGKILVDYESALELAKKIATSTVGTTT